MAAERTVYVKVGIKNEQALLGLRQLKRSLDGIAQQDLGKPRAGLSGLGKVNTAGLNKVQASMDGIAAQDFKRPQSGLDGLFTKANLVGAGLAVGIGKAVSSFADFDQQMSAVKAATGAADAGFNSLRDAAIVAGSDTQYSATEAASAITELSKAGLDATDILGGGLTGALSLAAAGQMGVADAAETMATALAQFKLKGDQASHVADLLAAGAGKAQGSVSDMGMALKQAGLVADQTGLSIEETTAGLTAFANAGLIGSDAGTSLKSMLQRLTPQSKEAANLMDDLGISAYDAQGNFVGLEKFAGNLRDSLKELTPEQRNSALATIFGSDAVRAASVLYEQGATGIAHWTEQVNQQGYAAKQAATLTDNLRGDIERLGGALDTGLIQGGSGANDMLRSLTKSAEGLVVGLSGIPAPALLGATALAGIAVLGPKISEAAKVITGPLAGGMARFREEMALHRALATQVVGGYQRLGDESAVAAGKVSKSAVAMSAARSTIGGLKGAAGGLLNVLGGPWGVALGAATVGIGMWAQGQADAKAAADLLNGTIDQQTGKFSKASQETIVAALMGDLSPEDVRLVQQLGINFTDLADAALQGGPAYERQKQKLVDLMNEHQNGIDVFSQESRATEGLLRSYLRSGDAADSARLKQEALNQARNDDAVATSRQAGSAATAERNMGDLGVAIDGVTASSSDGVGPVGDMAGGVKGMGDNADDAKKQLQGLIDLIDTFKGGDRAVAAGQRALRSATSDAVDAAANKGGADPDAVAAQKKAKDRLAAAKKSGDKGRIASAQDALTAANKRVAESYVSATEAQDAFDEKLSAIAADGETNIKNLIGQNKSIKDVNKAYDDTRAAILKALAARGIHGAAAEKEADKIFLTNQQMAELRFQYANTQGQVVTTFKTPGLPEAKAGVEGYWEVINGVPTFKPTTVTTPGIGKAKASLDGVWEVVNGIPRFVPITISVGASISTAAQGIIGGIGGIAGTVFKRATGGPILGAGTATSDSIPAMLSNGEHVLTAAEVAAAGGHGAIYALRKAILSGGVQYRAAGGPIAAPSSYRSAPAAPFRLDLSPLAQGKGGDNITLNAYGLDVNNVVQRVRRDFEMRDRS